MKRLFLASFFKEVADLFPGFAGRSCVGESVCFIPTAARLEKFAFYVGADRKALTKLGLVVTDLDVSTATEDEIVDRLSGADHIFVSGGNTFFLLQELRRTGADRLMVEQIEDGKSYIGSSAGSVVLARDIEYITPMDSPAVAPELRGDFAALSMVDFCVVPHATNAPFKKAVAGIRVVYGDRLDLRPISNNQAITVEGDSVRRLTA
ncbi:MAG: Type 1 glutamine amidotransferase-like domain-containing protein [Bifidobacteriaceae bacterium]|jgi:dipeptidase E|nr:Type 1 glutamine amidotransferase-like domain-containing protein [Bifidobacteriaceae bacterium]